MKRDFLKGLKWHIVFLCIAIFFICKFSSAPPLFDELYAFFSRPQEDTIQYELLRIAENLSLAYIASLIFYLIVDYIPLKVEERNTTQILEKHLCPLYMYMDKVVNLSVNISPQFSCFPDL